MICGRKSALMGHCFGAFIFGKTSLWTKYFPHKIKDTSHTTAIKNTNYMTLPVVSLHNTVQKLLNALHALTSDFN